MIYQSGYLTIKDYKPHRGTFLLDLPNNEADRYGGRVENRLSAEIYALRIKNIFTPYNNNLQSIQYYEDKRNKDQ